MAERDILIVDDDLQVREMLHQIFVAAGYNCLLAADGREGFEVFRRAQPDLIVTNFRMPVMDGIELLKLVRQEDPDAAVIVESGSAKIAIACLKLGAYAFISVPIHMDELLITAERALERRQLLIERREHQKAHGQRQETDRTTLGRADLAQRDVLIVEEDPGVRNVVQQFLLTAGYKCVLAKDGDEGLQVFRRWRPDLIVTDLKMPMVRSGERVPSAGIELLQQIRQEDPNAAVIVMSGTLDVKVAIASLKLGAHAFIMKPINFDELLITAERAIERRQLLIERRQRQEGA